MLPLVIRALWKNTTGSENTATGYQTLRKNTTGSDNTAMGLQGLFSNTTGDDNTSLGLQALFYNTTGDNNTAVGKWALSSVVTGGNNTSLGTSAGAYTTGSGGLFLGYKAGYNETASNKLYIANSDSSTPLIYGDFSTGALALGNDGDETGAIQIGTSGTRDITIGSANATTVVYGLRTSNVTDTNGKTIIRKDSTTGAIHIGENLYGF